MLGSDSHRFKSRPIEVLFCGFRSDTYRLQQAGWEIAIHEDFGSQLMQLTMRNRQAGVYAMSGCVAFDHFRYWRTNDQGIPPFVVNRVASDIHVACGVDFSQFRLIDANPQMVKVEQSSLSSMELFATPLVRTEEIIVEPQSVAECLEHIKRLQAPKLAEIRERNRRDEVPPQVKFHAQILSLAA